MKLPDIPRELQGVGMTSQRTRDRLAQLLRAEGIRHPAVLDCLRLIPRHIFVDEALASRAYENNALPIGHGQTISQPYIVARMTEAVLEAGRPRRVLEVGTGSGYQTAVLACLVPEVYSVERIRALQQKARVRLKQLGLHNITLRLSDGSWGWPEKGPFDVILVTAAPEEVPQPLLGQLADGGRLIIPVGMQGGRQRLLRITRVGDEWHEEMLSQVSFVPLVSGAGA